MPGRNAPVQLVIWKKFIPAPSPGELLLFKMAYKETFAGISIVLCYRHNVRCMQKKLVSCIICFVYIYFC